MPKTVSVPVGITLAINQGSTIHFAKDAGLDVHGSLQALGGKDDRITFTSMDGQQPASWGEVRVEYSESSKFSNCDFEYATWAIHSHFNSLPVVGCSFKNNGGGIRFRSGPLQEFWKLLLESSEGFLWDHFGAFAPEDLFPKIHVPR